jgi:hypothetical protein
MGPFLKSKNSEYILVEVDYVSKWVEVMPCRATDSKISNKIFEEVTFPRFRVPRIVIMMEALTLLTRTFTSTWKNMGSVTMSLLHTTLRQVAK